MDVLATVTTAIEAIRQGRETIKAITDAVRDGQTAISTKDMGQLNELLRQEQIETAAADNTLRRAIEVFKSK
jgi:aminoglycoside N3'-acetyltransferase